MILKLVIRESPIIEKRLEMGYNETIKNLEAYDEDLMALFGFIKYQKNRQELEAFIQRHAAYFNSVSRETAEAITNAADIREIQKYIQNQNETEGINMCDAIKQMQEESMQQGVQKGLQQGLQKGMQQGVRQVAVRLLRMNHPIPFIAQATELSEQEIEKIKESLEL